MIRSYFVTVLILLLVIPLGLLAQSANDNVNVGLTVTPEEDPGGGGEEPDSGLIAGWIYEDLNGNGHRSGEPGLNGWQVSLYQGNNIIETEISFGGNGYFFFTNLADGDYVVCENFPNDGNTWLQTDPTATSGSSWRSVGSNFLCPNGTYGYEVEVNNGSQNYGVDFGNQLQDESEVPNVSNFTATPGSNVINLNWANPVFSQLEAVRIVRLIGSIPTGPNDGELIYEGTGEVTVDSNVTAGVNYIYGAFVRSTGGVYSSGAIASAIIDVDDEEEPPDEEPIDESPGNDNIFDNYPSAIDNNLPLPTLLFIQPGRGSQALSSSGTVDINGEKELTIFLPIGSVPQGLKTIGLTLFAPADNSRSFSFILRLNEDQTGYTATLSPLGVSGRYNFVLHVINYKNQQIQRLNGALLVSASAGQLLFLPAATTGNLAIGLGIAVGLTQLLVVSTQAKSLMEIYLIIIRGISALLGYAGLRRKQQPWGTVYDAITKRPIDPAVVTVLAAGKEVGSAITDIDGRYGFFLPPGKYLVKAGKTHYLFPSQLLSGQTSDHLYNNLYFGEPIITTGPGEIIYRNIPLDPIGFDWNEFVKNKGNYFILQSRRQRLQTLIFSSLYILGFIVAIAHTLTSPSASDLVILAVYVAIYSGQRFWKYRYPALVLRRASGEPLSYSIIKVFLAGVDQEIKRVVTDSLGQFYLLVRPGEYYFTVEEKLPDASYKEVYRSAPQTLKTGVLKKDLIVP